MTEDEAFEVEFLDRRQPVTRTFRRSVPAAEIFGSNRGYAWGRHDKVYSFEEADGVIEVARASVTDGRMSFERTRDSVKVLPLPLVSAGVAVFGAVLEFDDALLVVASDGVVHRFDAPVNWRVFPASKYYENQLHLVYEDHLAIVSFNHDYFVDQATKAMGVRKALPPTARVR